jgi:cation/acetate symporter
VPAIFISLLLTGNPVPQLGFGGELKEAFGGGYLLQRLDGLNEELGFAAYTDGVRSRVDVACITAALMLGTAGLPHVIIRFFTVPSVRAARKSAAYALLFIAILYSTAPAISAFARLNLLNTVSNASYDSMPGWFRTWEATGLITFEDRNGDGLIQYVADPAVNELQVDRDIIVLANPEIAQLPNWVIALVAAGGLAAALSTAAGLLLVIATAVSHDLLKRNLMPHITEKQELLYARCAIFVAILIAGWFGIRPPGFVAQVVAFAFGLAAASFFPAIVMGIFSLRMNREGAISGMITGLLFTAAYIVYFRFINPAADSAEHWWFGVSPEGIGTLGMLLNFAVALGVSRFFPDAPRDVQRMVEQIRVPGSNR